MELANIFAIVNNRPLFLMTRPVSDAKNIARILRDEYGREIKLKRSYDSITRIGSDRQERVNICLNIVAEFLNTSSAVMTAEYNGKPVVVRQNAGGLLCI